MALALALAASVAPCAEPEASPDATAGVPEPAPALPQGVRPSQFPHVYVEFKPLPAAPALPALAIDDEAYPGQVLFLDANGRPMLETPSDWRERLLQPEPAAIAYPRDLPEGVRPGDIVPAPEGGLMRFSDWRDMRFLYGRIDGNGRAVVDCRRPALAPPSEAESKLAAQAARDAADAEASAEKAPAERSPLARLMAARAERNAPAFALEGETR